MASAAQRATKSHVTMILFLNVLILWEEGGNLSWDISPVRCKGIRPRPYFSFFFFFLRGKESQSSTSVAFSTFLHMQTLVGGRRAAKVRFVILGNLLWSRMGEYFSAPDADHRLETEIALQCV